MTDAPPTAVDVLWHDLECGGYGEDLPFWRALAADAGGPVLDVGAGTGRVSLALAGDGVSVVALDTNPALLAALRQRAGSRPVETVAADARAFALGSRFRLIVVPMQTLQLLGGGRGRGAFLRCAFGHLEPGGLLAAALADAMDAFDSEHEMPPPPDAHEVGGVRYASTLVAVTDEGGRAVIHRRREIAGPDGRHVSGTVFVELDRVSADEVAAEARAIGFTIEPTRTIPESERYLGSTVIVLRRPRTA